MNHSVLTERRTIRLNMVWRWERASLWLHLEHKHQLAGKMKLFCGDRTSTNLREQDLEVEGAALWLHLQSERSGCCKVQFTIYTFTMLPNLQILLSYKSTHLRAFKLRTKRFTAWWHFMRKTSVCANRIEGSLSAGWLAGCWYAFCI